MIHGNVDFPLPEPIVWVACELCGCAKKVLLRKRHKPRYLRKVTECFDTCAPLMADHPQMQQYFDDWIKTITLPPSKEKKKSGLPVPKPKRREPPKHRCQHTGKAIIRRPPSYLFTEIDESIAIPLPQETVVRCGRCPEPYRPWIRNDEADHTYEAMKLHLPLGKNCSDLKPSWEPRKDSIEEYCTPSLSYYQTVTFKSIQNPYDLRTKLKMILKKENII